MQPNNYTQPNQTPLQPNTTGLQPSIYYEYSQPTPPTPRAKSSPLPIILAVIFSILSVGLIVFIACDKLLPKNSEVEGEVAITIPLNTPLSQIEATEYANALSGRIFTIDGTFEQTIKFTSDKNYEYTYYANPATDVSVLDLSIKHGTFSVENNLITLDSGDAFAIEHDYLVKKTDKLSQTPSIIYFDSARLQETYTNITKAFKAKLPSWGGDASYKANKVYISHLICSTNSNRLTNADNYMCDAKYTLYFDDANIKNLLTEQKVTNFNALCRTYAGLAYYGGTCNDADYSISGNRNLVVRISNDSSYSITGIWTDLEVASAEDNSTEETTE